MTTPPELTEQEIDERLALHSHKNSQCECYEAAHWQHWCDDAKVLLMARELLKLRGRMRGLHGKWRKKLGNYPDDTAERTMLATCMNELNEALLTGGTDNG